MEKRKLKNLLFPFSNSQEGLNGNTRTVEETSRQISRIAQGSPSNSFT